MAKQAVPKTPSIHVVLTDAEIAAIDEWRWLMRLTTRSAVVRELIGAEVRRREEAKTPKRKTKGA